MKSQSVSFFLAVTLGLGLSGCGQQPINENAVPPPNTSVSPAKPPASTSSMPMEGNYNGKGTVTKIDLNPGSVELNHENIEGLMPAMQMEFYVTDKALLKGLAVGDKVDFVIEYKGGRETINSITKTK